MLRIDGIWMLYPSLASFLSIECDGVGYEICDLIFANEDPCSLISPIPLSFSVADPSCYPTVWMSQSLVPWDALFWGVGFFWFTVGFFTKFREGNLVFFISYSRTKLKSDFLLVIWAMPREVLLLKFLYWMPFSLKLELFLKLGDCWCLGDCFKFKFRDLFSVRRYFLCWDASGSSLLASEASASVCLPTFTKCLRAFLCLCWVVLGDKPWEAGGIYILPLGVKS